MQDLKCRIKEVRPYSVSNSDEKFWSKENLTRLKQCLRKLNMALIAD